jgi:tripeptide aminopeptidase
MLASKLLLALPREGLSPESTEGREGFIHPHRIDGGFAQVTIEFLLREFDNDKLAALGERLRGISAGIQASEPRAKITCEIKKAYRNMGYWLREDMRPVDFAGDAMRTVGLTPVFPAVRGGTDGSRLTERGLPTPNLFDGSYNLHGPLEWASINDMDQALATGIELVQIWARAGADYPRRPVQSKA